MNGIALSRAVSSPVRRAGAALFVAMMLSLPAARVAQADDGPSIVKPTLIVSVYEIDHTWMPTTKRWQENTTAWMPSVKFLVKGPVVSGSQFSVDFTKPNGALWWHLDLKTAELPADDWYTMNTGRSLTAAEDNKYTNGIGAFGFKIRLKNELAGTNQLLMTGKFNVSKVYKGMNKPKFKNKFNFVVDHDWTLPFGYMYFEDSSARPPLTTLMWFKGPVNGSSLAGYVFYNGKQIGSTEDQGSFATNEEQVNTTANDAKDPTWTQVSGVWTNISDKPVDPAAPNPALFYTLEHPGDYTIKVLRDGKLCREAKFTVADGKVVDNGLSAANNLGTDRMLLPVKIIGTADGVYGKNAWATGAFFGNPVKGFAAP